jgi:DNA-directed RNA polymerase subunit RPC12/RpoP
MKTRILGIVLMVVGLGVAAWLITGLLESQGSKAGYVLGLVLFSLPFFAVGLYLLLTSHVEIQAEGKADKQRTILNAVTTRGRVSVADLAIECNLTRDQVKQNIYDLIGKDLFKGYVNWEKGELVSAEAAQMKEDTCPNCGGKLELAGKGLVRCPYCGTEIYLSAVTSYAASAPVPPAPAYSTAAPPAGPPPVAAFGPDGDGPTPGQA